MSQEQDDQQQRS